MLNISVDVPPGLEQHKFTGVASAGGAEEWLKVEGLPVDPNVNGFIYDEENQKILLMWGKSGFGKGKYLPIMAPLPAGADPKEVVAKATKGQTGGLEGDPSGVIDVGGFFITIDGEAGKPPFVCFAKALKITKWTGEPTETETRKPEWFAASMTPVTSSSLPPLPAPKMFEDELHWYPHFLAGRRVIGRVEYAAPPNDEDKDLHLVGPLKKWWFGFTD
ncbi:hypothetical protein DL93DRAFT_1667570 [Clavulina sp. PMI_390]|nr:hypothetical protein DL93DRAFT_1667570 [Clavulina sp. PMI_390]